jgi:inorganic pyrophosphatase
MTIVFARAIGMMTMRDDKGVDAKIIAISLHDPAFSHYSHIRELPQHTLAELKRFFQDYKTLENKIVEVDEFLGPYDAIKTIREAMKDYDERQRRLSKPPAATT